MRNEREQRREGFSRAEARSQVQSAVVLGMGWWGVGTMTFCTRAGKRITSQVKSSQVKSSRVGSGQVRSGQVRASQHGTRVRGRLTISSGKESTT